MSTHDSTSEPRDPRDSRVPVDPASDVTTPRAAVPADHAHTVPVDSRDDRTVPVDTRAASVDDRDDRDDRDVRSDDDRALQREIHAREKEEFGGFKFGSAFFGWLTAMGTTVLLTALVTAIGAAIGIGNDVSPDEAAESALGPGGIVAAVVIGLVLLISYYAGGYVAGRMARFSGAKQGIAVWLWAIVVAVIVAIITAIAGAQWDILGNMQGFPRIPVTPETATLTGILTAVGAAVITLIGAILGGLAGMRFHRKVDRVGLDRR